MDKITALREKIDLLDDSIMALLEERYTLTSSIGSLKKDTHIEVQDSKREDYIFKKISKYGHSPSIELVYKTIIDESKHKQRK